MSHKKTKKKKYTNHTNITIEIIKKKKRPINSTVLFPINKNNSLLMETHISKHPKFLRFRRPIKMGDSSIDLATS